jgi:hypothetical protein
MRKMWTSGSLVLLVISTIYTLKSEEISMSSFYPITDQKPAVAVYEPESIQFRALSSITSQLQVREAPEMPDLPPIRGTINVTLLRVADPRLPDPPAPLSALSPNDPGVIAGIKEFRNHFHSRKFIFLSATVYDRSRTLLKIYPNGKSDSWISAWSNIDFSHFSACPRYRIKLEDGKIIDCDLMMGISRIDTYQQRKLIARHQKSYISPEIPEMPDLAARGPAFIVNGGNDKGEAMETLQQLHELYRTEGVKMEEIVNAREKSHAERHAFLLANPPKPKDLVLHYWRGSESGINKDQR